jgi:Family of unknown function (DUF6804)
VGSSAGQKSLFLIAVCAGAIVVCMQAVRARRYFWMTAFAMLAVIFNPILRGALSFNPSLFLVFDATAVILFIVSLQVLKNRPRLSPASITDRTPGSESL